MRRREALLCAATITGIAGCLGSAPSTVERWRFRTDQKVDSPPAIAAGTVCIGSMDFNLYAIDAGDGTERWRFETHQAAQSYPAVAGVTV